MKVLLVDVDSKIPNLALMKLSTFHKNKGDEIDFKKLGYTYYPDNKNQTLLLAEEYDKVYISIIFQTNKNSVRVVGCEDVEFGGSGYDYTIKLDQEIDNLEEDYSLYPENEFSYGFITRGCIRNCYFCIVPKKEGMIYRYREIDQIVKHKKVKFMDNNILAHKDCELILQELVDKKVKCQFNQGLDLRLITDKKAELLSKMNYLGEYYFAFDNLKDRELIEKKLEVVKRYIKKDWKLKFFLYCNPDMSITEDVLVRVNWCKKNKFLPYLMRDISCWKSPNKDFYTDLTAWCNQPSLFKNMTFEEFIVKRTNNVERQKNGIQFVSLAKSKPEEDKK